MAQEHGEGERCHDQRVPSQADKRSHRPAHINPCFSPTLSVKRCVFLLILSGSLDPRKRTFERSNTRAWHSRSKPAQRLVWTTRHRAGSIDTVSQLPARPDRRRTGDRLAHVHRTEPVRAGLKPPPDSRVDGGKKKTWTRQRTGTPRSRSGCITCKYVSSHAAD